MHETDQKHRHCLRMCWRWEELCWDGSETALHATALPLSIVFALEFTGSRKMYATIRSILVTLLSTVTPVFALSGISLMCDTHDGRFVGLVAGLLD